MRMAVGLTALAVTFGPLPAVAAADETAATNETASVSGTRFFDRNGDGVRQQGEIGTSAGGWQWTVYLETPSGEPVGESVINEAGSYGIENVPAGEYVLVFPDTSLYKETTPLRVPVTLEAGQEAVVDTGIQGGKISGMAWEDTNGDGQRQEGEPPLEGVKVSARSDGAIVYTAADGTYVFEDRALGDHEITFERKAGFSFSPPLVGHPETDSNVIDGDEGVAEADIWVGKPGFVVSEFYVDAGYVPQ